MGEHVDDAEPSDGSYDSDVTGSSGSESESDAFSPQQPAQVMLFKIYRLCEQSTLICDLWVHFQPHPAHECNVH